MADDMDDIEDLLEAPYKNGNNHSHPDKVKAEEVDDDEQFVKCEEASVSVRPPLTLTA